MAYHMRSLANPFKHNFFKCKCMGGGGMKRKKRGWGGGGTRGPVGVAKDPAQKCRHFINFIHTEAHARAHSHMHACTQQRGDLRHSNLHCDDNLEIKEHIPHHRPLVGTAWRSCCQEQRPSNLSLQGQPGSMASDPATPPWEQPGGPATRNSCPATRPKRTAW